MLVSNNIVKSYFISLSALHEGVVYPAPPCSSHKRKAAQDIEMLRCGRCSLNLVRHSLPPYGNRRETCCGKLSYRLTFSPPDHWLTRAPFSPFP